MDAFLMALRDLCSDILPILSAVCLICLIIFLLRLIKVADNATETLSKTHGTIDLVDKSIEKVQAPLDTVVKVSGTVDKAHDATVTAAKEATEYVRKNATEVKEKVTEFINEYYTKKEELKEPSPEDIIGGKRG